jgi:para-aminobenzoate synthetase/4-amino-4-deoxychorismate lyase
MVDPTYARAATNDCSSRKIIKPGVAPLTAGQAVDADGQPDPARGIFSTALVVEGEIVALDDHLRRLSASAGSLYGMPPPEGIAHAARQAAAEQALARLRITLVPELTGGLTMDITVAAIPREIVLPGWDRAARLRSVEVPGWTGAHKLADRRLLEDLDASCAPESALLVDGDGNVLETARANVFVVDAEGVLCTPPADGRVLPGIARDTALALARETGVPIRERAVSLGELAASQELFTTGSIRGVEPVCAVDETTFHAPGPLTLALAELLGGRWFGHGR